MNHQIFQPHIDLADFVKSYWVLEGEKDETPNRNTIVPDGCVKMIFHYADPYKHLISKDKNEILPKSFVVGQLTLPFEVSPMGKTGTFLICFQPDGFQPFASFPIKEIENKTVELSAIFGSEGMIFSNKMLNAENTTQRIALANEFLLKQLTDKQKIDQIVKTTVETLFNTNKKLSILELSKQNNISQKGLERKFSSAIGLRPKQLSKIIRLQNTLKILLNEEVRNFATLAYENEYYDQAHFIKDFKEFTGLTPTEFYGDELKMSLIFERKN